MSEKKIVLMVSSFAPPHAGGLEVCAEQMFKLFNFSDVSITWLVSDVPKMEASKNTIRIPVFNLIERVTGIPIPIPTPAGVMKLISSVRKSHAIHVHDIMYLSSWLSVTTAFFFRIPWSVTVHIWKVPYQSPFSLMAQNISHAIGSFICLNNARWISCYSQDVFRRLNKIYGSKVHFIANPIHPAFTLASLENLEASRILLRQQLDWSCQRKQIVFAGRLVEKKGLFHILNFARAFPSCDFHIHGSGPLKLNITNLNNVILYGETSKSVLAERFIAGDLFLLPSKGEGFPLSIQEAMSCGMPCSVFKETWEAWGANAEQFIFLDDFENLDACFSFSDTLELRRTRAAYARSQWSSELFTSHYEKLYKYLVIEIPH